MDTFTLAYRLPHGFVAEFQLDLSTIKPGKIVMNGFCCQWSPRTPQFQQQRARRKFLEAYTVARDDFMQGVAQMIGGSVAIVDLNEHYQPTTATVLAPQVPS